MLVRSTVAALVLALAPSVLAQETPSLAAGKPAPAFKVEKFLKGDGFTSFEKGKIYVVEFWATWCGPCIMSMPHLSELQREYKDKGVTITGVNVWEEREYTEATLKKAADFVAARGDAMNYTVAFDGAAKHMDSAWMQASGQNGIPAAFVVDGTGTIAWIGHPMELDMVLDEVVKGSWSITEGPKKIEAAGKAYMDAAAKYADGLAAGDEAWKQAEEAYPILAKSQAVARFGGMMTAKHTAAAYALGHKIVDDAVKAKNPLPIMGVLGAFMGGEDRPADFDASLLLKAAKANFDLAPDDYSRYAMITQVYFSAGEIDLGRAAKATAIEKADAQIKDRLKAWLDQSEAEAVAKKEKATK